MLCVCVYPRAVIARERRQAALEDALRSAIITIAGHASSKMDHIPPIDFTIGVPMIYSFEVSLSNNDATSKSYVLTVHVPSL